MALVISLPASYLSIAFQNKKSNNSWKEKTLVDSWWFGKCNKLKRWKKWKSDKNVKAKSQGQTVRLNISAALSLMAWLNGMPKDLKCSGSWSRVTADCGWDFSSTVPRPWCLSFDFQWVRRWANPVFFWSDAQKLKLWCMFSAMTMCFLPCVVFL